MATRVQVLRGSLPAGRYTLDERGTLGGHVLYGARYEMLPERPRTIPPGGMRARTIPPGATLATSTSSSVSSRPPQADEKLVHVTLSNGHSLVARMSSHALSQLRTASSRPPAQVSHLKPMVWLAVLSLAGVALFAALFIILAS